MGGPIVHVAAGLGAGLVGGLLSGLLGVGGGIVLVPLLSFLLGMRQHEAQGVTLTILLLPNSLPAVLAYRRRGIRVPLELVGVMILTFLLGVVLGARGAVALPERPLKGVFVLVLAGMALRSFWQASVRREEGRATAVRFLRAKGALIGLLGGLTSGLLGIGGAVVLIPLLVLWVGLTQHEAQFASLLVLLPPVGLPGVWVYHRAVQHFPWGVAAGVAVGFSLGAFLGALGATRMNAPRLQRLFALVMGFLAILLFLRI